MELVQKTYFIIAMLTRSKSDELIDFALGVGLPLLMLCRLLAELSSTLCLLKAPIPATDCLALTAAPFVFFIGRGVG